MRKVLSFYFDGAVVQAVTLRIAGNSVVVDDAKTLPFEDLGEFLSTRKEKSCIVCCNPQLFYQDILCLPPAATKHYDGLVRNEIRNVHPDLASFSCFHRIIGESVIDSRPFNRVAVFSYPDEFLSTFISELSRFNISISSLYAAPYCILRAALSTCDADFDLPRIFIASLLGEKLVLVCENGELEFIRKIPALDSALLPDDGSHINMTVDYCFQSLRLRPIEAVMLNQTELSEDLSSFLSIPYRAALPPKLKELPPHIIQDYLAPVAAALHSVTSPHLGNVMPSDYSAFSLHKKLLSGAALFMFVLTLLLGGYLIQELMATAELKTRIGRIRTELSGAANELGTFRKIEAEANQLKQPLEFVSKHNAMLNPAAALAALSMPEIREYLITEVTVQSGDAGLDVKLHGSINASVYGDIQALFESFVAKIAKLPGYSIISSTVDIRQKTFHVQARYIGGGQPGK